jgi:predicted alpha/beta hydrolase family esterase
MTMSGSDSEPPLALTPYAVVLVAGYGGAGPGHWQSHWSERFPRFHRITQDDWFRPDKDKWVDALDRGLHAIGESVIVVAHSLGCITVAHLARERPTVRIAGAMLVAPADADRPDQPYGPGEFAPIPMSPLPFASIVVLSRNDRAVSQERGEAFGRAWGSEVRELEEAGHIDAIDGYGPWPEGLDILRRFVERLGEPLRPIAAQHPEFAG